MNIKNLELDYYKSLARKLKTAKDKNRILLEMEALENDNPEFYILVYGKYRFNQDLSS